MSATEVLRRMLDERGVPWKDCGNGATYVEYKGEAWRFDYDELFDQLAIVCLSGYTPAQAVEATLGSCNCTNDCANGERMDVPCLPHFWTHDGTLHIEATRMPTRIVVCEGGTCEFVPKRELYVSEAENTKLRELVRILKNCADECGDCDTCPINDGSGVLNPWLGCDSLRDRMRELGVEVDE